MDRRAPYTQAERIVAKLGGAKAVASFLGLSVPTVYRWTYPVGHGTGGLIPWHHKARLDMLAEALGVELTPEDWMPTERGR